MAEPIVVRDLRSSFAWVETVPNRLRESELSGPAAFLGQQFTYESQFERVLAGERGGLGLQVPWPKPTGEHFWALYLGLSTNQRLSTVPRALAWSQLVPFRLPVPVAKIEAPWFADGRLVLESFLYPHGLALVATATCRGRFGLQDAVEKSHQVRRTGEFAVRWGDGRQERVNLDGLADRCLTTLRRDVFGDGVPASDRSVTPFTIWAVVNGEGGAALATSPPAGEVLRALAAVTSWSPTWPDDTLPEPTEVSVKMRQNAPPGHILYGSKRGRAVWFPGSFGRAEAGPPTVACFRRNLARLSLQVESLGGFAEETARRLDDAQELAFWEKECARRTAGVLGRLYGAVEDTYKSGSPRVQIEQNDLAPAINRVRAHFGMPALH